MQETANTVITAFELFLTEEVNLDAEITARARASRDWLVSQVRAFPTRVPEFPQLYSDIDIHYGSFERRTKIRELDDLDTIVGISGLGTTYETFGKTVRLEVPDNTVLRGLCHAGTNLLNSRRVVNKVVEALASVPQYEMAEISRNGSAAVLKLQSYLWTFDVVPGFITSPEYDGRTFYVIPDGQGHWMKTDPRIDRDRAIRINREHHGHVLDPLRLLKFWNRRPTMPSISPYMLETLVLDYYEAAPTSTAFVDLEFIDLLGAVSSAVMGRIEDPKGIQGDLNELTLDERVAIAARANADLARANNARIAELEKDYRKAISLWGSIFGPSFPRFG